MSQAMAGSGEADASGAIPPGARQKVQSIKEIVERSHSEEEIYAMLNECNMDAEEALQRLLDQDTFHEVKRKRDKKRENNKEGSDIKPARGPGANFRGGRYGRGSSGPRYNNNESGGGGRGRGMNRENGYYTRNSPQDAAPPSSASAAPPPPKPAVTQSNSGSRPQNGPVHQRARFSEVLKSNGGPPPQPPGNSAAPPRPPVNVDPVVDKPVEPGPNRRAVGPVGMQRTTNEAGDVVVDVPVARASMSDVQTLQSGVSSASAAHSTPRVTFSTTRPALVSQQPPVGTQRSVQEWKAKPKPPPLPVAESVEAPEPVEVQKVSAPLPKPAEKSDQSVFIHNQFLVPADLTLNFGSLNFGSEDETLPPKPSEVAEVEEPLEEADEQPSPSAVSSTHGSVDRGFTVQQTSPSPLVDDLPSNSEVTAVSIAIPVVSHAELSKPDSLQSSHYPYLPAAYSGFGLMQPGTQYQYESTDSQQSDGSRVSSLHQPYSDPTASYYPFRPSLEGDTRFPLASSKSRYSGGSSAVSGQPLATSESSTSSSSLAQTSQPVSGQSVPTLPHQPVPHLHAGYSAQPGLHLGYNVFNYPYLPQSVPYIHPYQHSYTGSNAYPQPPAGSNYTPTNNYPANTGKYPVTQYKPVAATASTSSAAAGYAGYSSTPTGYATNPTVTIGTASVYDDVGGPQYKDNNIYLQSQQAEGSGVWLSRDSYYNIPGQSQHTAYAHAYGSLYHPTQSVPAPHSHQMLQQPQALATAGSQGAAYGQQPQRAQQQTWTNNY